MLFLDETQKKKVFRIFWGGRGRGEGLRCVKRSNFHSSWDSIQYKMGDWEISGAMASFLCSSVVFRVRGKTTGNVEYSQ